MGEMTHYMELLSTNQPWHLLIFMAIPVICAETLAVTELMILFSRNFTGTARKINRVTGIFAGIYFFGIFLYLMPTAFLPLTFSGQWRGIADIVAVSFYLMGIIPLGGITLLELGFIHKNRTKEGKLALHATFVGFFLIIAHIAMIFGMLDPHLFMMHSGIDMNMRM